MWVSVSKEVLEMEIEATRKTVNTLKDMIERLKRKIPNMEAYKINELESLVNILTDRIEKLREEVKKKQSGRNI